MRKTFLMSLLVLACSICSAGNVNPLYGIGYRSNLEFNAGSTFGGKNSIGREFNGALTTSHGYSNGKGFYAGIGTGIVFTPNNYAVFSIPVFADLKYSFRDDAVAPFLSLKAGTEINTDNGSAGLSIAPSVGLDLKRFSVFLKYDFGTGKLSYFSSNSFIEKNYNKHALSVGASYWF